MWPAVVDLLWACWGRANDCDIVPHLVGRQGG